MLKAGFDSDLNHDSANLIVKTLGKYLPKVWFCNPLNRNNNTLHVQRQYEMRYAIR